LPIRSRVFTGVWKDSEPVVMIDIVHLEVSEAKSRERNQMANKRKENEEKRSERKSAASMPFRAWKAKQSTSAYRRLLFASG